VIHRRRYTDWSFPKGKPIAGENPERTALREVEEETGIRCRLGRPIGQLYQDLSGETKAVRDGEMHPLGGTFIPAAEVDEMRWLGLDDATALLTAEHDQRLLEMMGIPSMEFSVGGQEEDVPAPPSSGPTLRGPSAPCAAAAPPVSARPRRTNATPTAIAAPRIGPTT